jgi:hypothetical protein
MDTAAMESDSFFVMIDVAHSSVGDSMEVSYPQESTGRDEFVPRIFGCAGEDTSAVFVAQRAGHLYTSSSSVWVHKTWSIQAESMQVSGPMCILFRRGQGLCGTALW